MTSSRPPQSAPSRGQNRGRGARSVIETSSNPRVTAEMAQNQRLIAYAFHFEFTPPGGPTFVDDVSKPAPRNGRLDRCTFSFADPDGTVSAIVWPSYTPAREGADAPD